MTDHAQQSPRRTGSLQRRIEELGVEEYLQLLRTRFVGRLAYVVDEHPRIMPLDYAIVDGSIVLRTQIV